MESGPDAGTVNILIVDDESRNLDVLESILTSPELKLIRAQSAEEALLALMSHEFACMVLDIQMPTMSGLELARLIKTRKRNQHIPIIFLTAYFLEERDVLQGYGAGAVDYLTKPINPQILRSKVGVFVDLFRTARALAAANSALEAEIAQRKSAEEALRQINSELEITGQKIKWQLAAIVETSDDAIVSKDTDGLINSWNKGAERLFGYTAAEVIGRPITIIIPEERHSEELDILSRIRRGEHIGHYETVRRRKDGTLIDVSLTISPIRNADGKVLGASKIARDITERRRIEQELKRAHDEILTASRAKDNFLATLSHELRTPLNPILLIASDAVQNPQLPADVRADYEMILKNVELEARLIDDLLDLTRIARGKILLEKKRVDVHGVLLDSITNVREEIRRKKIELSLNLSETPCAVFGDPVRLQQIFWNVIRNAVKFTPIGGHITVQTEVSNRSRMTVRVTDTGIGMVPAEIARLFTAFSQAETAENSVAHRLGGLGVGLAISQKLVELHSGRIQAFSQGRDKGSTFTIELPLMPVAAGDQTASTETDGTANPPVAMAPPKEFSILVVEDHEPTRTTLAGMLKRRNYRVTTASSLAEARSAVNSTPFDLIISDLGLPDGTGYELMSELKKRGTIPGIALTGYGMAADIARTREAGFVAHLTKPVHAQSLEAALNTAAQCIQTAVS